MYKQETLTKEGKRLYTEPEGEFLEIMTIGSNTITVLTRIESGKAAAESPINPEGFTVSEIRDYINSNELTDGQLRALIEAEQQGKDRTTATDVINNRL